MRLTRRVSYEWALEHKDEHDDIIDIEFFDPTECPKLPTSSTTDLALVRYEAEGYPDDPDSYMEDYRTYAYPKDGKLPAEFEDRQPIPKRLQKEFSKANPEAG